MNDITLEKLTKELQLLQPSIDFEYQLNDGRINSLLVFNGIEIAAVGILITNNLFENGLATAMSVLLCALLGWRITSISKKSIDSGIKQIKTFKERREEILRLLPEDSIYRLTPRADTVSIEHKNGILPYLEFPKLLLYFWRTVSAVTFVFGLCQLLF